MESSFLLLLLVLLPFCGALFSWMIGRKSEHARDLFADALCAAELILSVVLLLGAAGGRTYGYEVRGVFLQGLHLELDGFRAVMIAAGALLFLMTTLFSPEYLRQSRNNNRYYLFLLLTCAASMGVFLSSDLFTTFLFFEVMSLASYVLVVHEETENAFRAGGSYLVFGVLGGMVMLMGLFLLQYQLGTLKFSELLQAAKGSADKRGLYAAGVCLLFGFGVKAGMFPLHTWLPGAYQEAPAPASALLSGFLSKCGIFGVLVTGTYLFEADENWGKLILVLGAATMLLGALLAVFSVNLKRTLACSSMSQIGFILVGAGMQQLLGEEKALAVRGTFLHMVNHSLIKLVLFLAAGVIFMNLRRLDLNEVRGFGRGKIALHFAFLMSALGVSGVPLWNGYVSKTLLHESIAEYVNGAAAAAGTAGFYRAVEWLFLICGGLTFAYMAKLYVCIFLEKNLQSQEKMDSLHGSYMNRVSAAALILPAVLMPVIGIFTGAAADRLADLGQGFMNGTSPEEAAAYFSPQNLKGALISLLIGAAVYFFFVRTFLMAKRPDGEYEYVDRWPAHLNLEDMLYRPLMLGVLPFIGAFFSRILDKAVDTVLYVLKKTVFRDKKPDNRLVMFSFMRFNSRETSVQRQILTSFSFSLMLFAVGFSIILIYLVLV